MHGGTFSVIGHAHRTVPLSSVAGNEGARGDEGGQRDGDTGGKHLRLYDLGTARASGVAALLKRL